MAFFLPSHIGDHMCFYAIDTDSAPSGCCRQCGIRGTHATCSAQVWHEFSEKHEMPLVWLTREGLLERPAVTVLGRLPSRHCLLLEDQQMPLEA